jgi:hypothetical protein
MTKVYYENEIRRAEFYGRIKKYLMEKDFSEVTLSDGTKVTELDCEIVISQFKGFDRVNGEYRIIYGL